MPLLALNGARSMTNDETSDIPIATYNDSTQNGAGLDMREFNELVAHLMVGVVVGSATLTAVVQESNDNSTFTNITNAAFTITADNDDNKTEWLSVDWRHPDRKRYARAQTVAGGSQDHIHGLTTLRLAPRSDGVVSNGADVIFA